MNASDPEHGQLTYSAQWGDEWYVRSAPADFYYPGAPITQSTTFTHSYESAGTYTVRMLVRDSVGKEAKTTTTVQVGGTSTICPSGNAPVCGRPTGCANTCPAGYQCATACALQSAVTYPSMCHLTAANAAELHSGACLSNE